MRKYTVILFIILSYGLHAQSFFKKYMIDTSLIERKQNIHFIDGELFTSTMYISGVTFDMSVELVLDQLDVNNGDLISRIKYPNEYSFEPYKSIQVNNSILGMGWQRNENGPSASNLGVYKIRADNELQFFVEIGDSTRRDIPADVVSSKMGNIIIGSRRKFNLGAGYIYKTVVTKLDSNGVFLWEYIDEISYALVEMRSVATDDAEYIYALSNQDASTDSLRLTKLTPDGSKLWSRTYQEGFLSLAQQILNLKNGNLLIAGYGFYEKYDGSAANFYMEIDTAGNPIWVKDYRLDVGSVAYESWIKILEDGRIARVYDGYGYPTLMVNHPDGEVDFVRYYWELDVRFPADLLQMDDGSFVIIGWINPNSNTEGYTSWMMRTDTKGNLVTSIEEIEHGGIEMRVYPNPTSNTLDIVLGDNKDNWEKILIWNNAGHLVREEEVKTKIDVSSLASGFYSISVIDKSGNIVSSKFIKQ